MSIEKRFPGVLFLGTDTEVGKTYQAMRLARQLRSRQVDLGVYKPVASGVTIPSMPSAQSSNVDEMSDPYLLCQAADLDVKLLSRVCPQTFAAPLAPPSAAALEGRQVDEDLIRNGFRWWQEHCTFLIVEAAGGVMSPISSKMTCLDLAIELQYPVVLVAANRLGCVSHTLLAAEAIKSRGLNLLAIILNDLGDRQALAGQVSVGQDDVTDLSQGNATSLHRRIEQQSWYRQTVESSQELLKAFLPTVPLLTDAKDILDSDALSKMPA